MKKITTTDVIDIKRTIRILWTSVCQQFYNLKDMESIFKKLTSGVEGEGAEENNGEKSRTTVTEQ